MAIKRTHTSVKRSSGKGTLAKRSTGMRRIADGKSHKVHSKKLRGTGPRDKNK